jgi:hypothetical protein
MIDQRIIKFLKKHHVLTVATSVNNEAWCANCFYTYLENDNLLVFTTSEDTRHGKEFMENSFVAGSVVLETTIVGKIQGIQFQGIIYKPAGEELDKVKSRYLKRFPIAALMDTNIWAIKPTYIKMTDNRFGFGKKLIWTAE